jgi:putative DNA primase/helicase
VRSVGTPRAWDPEVIDQAIPQLPEPSGVGRSGSTNDEPPVELGPEALMVWRGEKPKLKDDGRVNRSSTLVKIGRVLYDAHANRAVIVAALRERDAALGYRKYADRADAGERYHEIVDELERTGRNGSARLVSSSGRNGGGEYRHTPTDQGNAERFVDDHGADVCYCHQSRTWHVFDGQRWKADDSGEVVRRTKRTARGIFIEAANAPDDGAAKALGAWAKQSLSEARIRATMELAKSEAEIAVTSDQLDTDPWLLNVANGTIDLRTGKLRKHRREDLLTKLAPVEYDPEASAPTFERFLERILPSMALRRFVQRAVGYSLTADTRERILLILYGTGRNGKSTLLEVIREIIGDYAMKTPAETLLAKPAGGVPNDIARLKGARFVSASETEANRRLAEALVKEITGQDTISARFMRAEFFDFKPTHKTWLATNHKPTIRGTDPAIWDRIRLVPFEVRIPDEEVDRQLPEKLRAELPGVLRWALRGCLDWQAEGLGEPDEVRTATEGYRAEMDVLAAFLDERCMISPTVRAQASPLYKAYRDWCESAGEKPESQRGFGMRLTERGFERKKSRGVYWWLGVRLSDDAEGGP